MKIKAYHGTHAEVEGTLTAGALSIDRMVGVHCSATPKLANLFALKNPGGKGRGRLYGGRVYPLALEGPVYQLNQRWIDFPDSYGWLKNDETGGMLELCAHDTRAFAQDIGRTVLPLRRELLERYATLIDTEPGRLLASLEHGNSWWLVGCLSPEAGEHLQADLAKAYREILRSKGYGCIAYLNTGKKEQVGTLEDHRCYVSLSSPEFMLSRPGHRR